MLSMQAPVRMLSARDRLAGRRLVVVSNREPYEHRLAVGQPAAVPCTGGVAVALDAAMQRTGGTWVAWGSGSADFMVTDASNRVPVPEEAPGYVLRRVALSPAEVGGYYHGYANQALWPLCHVLLDRVRLSAAHWSGYRGVNGRFAEAVNHEAPPGAVVWLHDYHLALCPRMLRRQREDLFLMHFWHIPWPAWDVFRVCPQRAELIDGLLANDLLVFQRPRDAEHFRDAAVRAVNATVAPGGRLEHRGHRVRVEAMPIGVDAAALDALARSAEAQRWTSRLTRHLKLDTRRVVVSVDRVDYTKGIVHRLRAIAAFLERWPVYRGQVVFVQKTAVSRAGVPAYRELQREIDAHVKRINAAYHTEGWTPVLSLARPLPRAALAALYRRADVCMVSSLRDGMNLVAKEFIACQTDDRGALLLSEFAGASEELEGAFSINPFDPDECAERLRAVLALPPSERRARMERLRAQVADHDVYRWVVRHLDAAAAQLAEQSATAARRQPVNGDRRPAVAAPGVPSR